MKAFDQRKLHEWIKVLREDIILMTNRAGSGHPGGSLSAIDIIGYLYACRMNLNPHDPHWEDRDRFILSKGHCAPALYAALAESGFFEKELLWTLRDIGSNLQGHPDMKKTPGVDMTTGSLGMGLSCGVGMALGGKLDGKGYHVYVMLGDGEMQCGQIHEAMLTAAHHRLDNITAIVDRNGYQCDDAVDRICALGDLKARFESYGWECVQTGGHDLQKIHQAFESLEKANGRPKAIIADTIKGKGVCFMEGDNLWHGTPPSDEQCARALAEIRSA